jgi:hypothetical protein
LTRDQVRLLKTDKMVSGVEPTLGDLGVQPRLLEEFLAVFKGGQRLGRIDRIAIAARSRPICKRHNSSAYRAEQYRTNHSEARGPIPNTAH